MKKISFLIPVLVIATISMYCGKAPEAPKAETGAEAITAEPKGTPTSINIEKSMVKFLV